MNQVKKENEQIIRTIEKANPKLGDFLRSFVLQDPSLQDAFLESWRQLLQIWRSERYGVVGIRIRPKSVRVVSAKAKIFENTEKYLDTADKFLFA